MITPEQQIFLDTLRHCGNVSEAARIAKISRARLYKMKASDKKFAKAWGSALEEAADRLTDEAIRRALRLCILNYNVWHDRRSRSAAWISRLFQHGAVLQSNVNWLRTVSHKPCVPVI